MSAACSSKRVRRRRRAATKAEARALLQQMKMDVDAHGHLGDAQRLVSEAVEAYLRLRRISD